MEERPLITSPSGIVYQVNVEDNGTLFTTLYKEDFSVIPATLAIDKGNTQQLQFQIVPVSNQQAISSVTWSSSDSNIATVNNSGVVSTKNAGSTTITATATTINGETLIASSSITVNYTGPSEVILDQKDLNLEVGENFTLTYSILPEDAVNQNVIWNSSNPLIATVDGNGVVTAVAEGTCVITVTTEEGGFTDSCNVTVFAEVITPPIHHSEIFRLDFSNKQGEKTNTLTDIIHNIPCKLVNVSHDGINDGYIDNKGLTIKTSGYVEVPVNNSILHGLMDFSKGVTFEYVAYDLDGIYFRNESGSIRAFRTDSSFQYLSTNNSLRTTLYGSAFLADPEGVLPNKPYGEVTNGSNEINVVTVRFHPDGRSETSINGWHFTYKPVPPADFSRYADMFASSALFIRRNLLGLNTKTVGLRSFSIFNKTLTNEEVFQRYNTIKQAEPLYTISLYPSKVEIQPGENQQLLVRAYPKRYNDLITTTFDSGNSGFVTVDQNGLLTGVNNGATEVLATSTYKNRTFINYTNVTVGSSSIEPPASARVINGISINRKTNKLEVGQDFAAMATTLPFDVLHDNYVLWESSNPEVCSVTFGVLKGISPGTSTITAFDVSKTYSASFTVTVVPSTKVTATESETYYVPLEAYGIRNDNTNSIDTTNGIRMAWNYASSNNYKKVVFPYGTYLVTPVVGKLQLPSNMIVDFSNSIINIEHNAQMTKNGYIMFEFNNVIHTKLINANIYANNPYTSLQEAHETCISVMVAKAYRSGIENCTVSKSPGFNIATHASLASPHEPGRDPSFSNWEAGGINEQNGLIDDTIKTYSFRTKTFLSIASLREDYMFGYSLGYWGYPYLRSRLYSIFFYDSNYKFIEAQKYNLQFYYYPKPPNARYAKIVIYQDSPPTNHDTDFSAVAMLRTFNRPIDCFIRNCIIEDNWSTGIAMTGGEGWVIEGNRFARNGRRMPNCDIDWEDGWEGSVGDICRNNTFNSPSGIIVSGVSNIVIHSNQFNNSHLYIWSRTTNWKAYNNYFNGKGANRNLNLGCQADSYFARNMLVDVNWGVVAYAHNSTERKYAVHFINNTLL